MTNKTYLWHIFRSLSLTSYKNSLDELKKGNLRHLIKNTIKIIRNWYRVRCFRQGETVHPTKESRKNTINVCQRYGYVGSLKKQLGMHDLNSEVYECNDGTQIHLRFADALIKKVESVAAFLGEFYLFSVRMPWDEYTPYSHERLKKVIISQGNQQCFDILQNWTCGKGLREQLIKVFPRRSRLYIMSNLWKPFDEDYFGPLRSSFKVYRYYDFPELVQLAEGEKCNTAQLKLIEMQLKNLSADSLTLDYIRRIWAIQNPLARFDSL